MSVIKNDDKFNSKLLEQFDITVSESVCPNCNKEPCECEEKELKEADLFSGARTNSIKLMDMIDDHVISSELVVKGLINWLSEDEVTDFMRQNDLLDDEDDIEESVLTEKLPADLIAASKNSGGDLTFAANGDYLDKIDIENSDATALSYDEAKELIENNPAEVLYGVYKNLLVKIIDHHVYSYNKFTNVDEKDAYIKRTGKKEYKIDRMPLDHVLHILDKIYKVNKVSVDKDKMISRGASVDEPNSREYNYQLGKSRENALSYDHEYYQQKIENYKKLLATLEKEYTEDGVISRKDYEERKAHYEQVIKSYRDKLDQYNFKIQNKRANARYGLANKLLSEPLNKLKELKSNISFAQSRISTAQSKLNQLKDNPYNSDQYKVAQREFQKINSKYWQIKASYDYWKKQLDDITNNTEANNLSRNIEDDNNKIQSLQAEIDQLLKR